MIINEVMKITGLTKKAIYYYEGVGLINPIKDKENDYRIYTEEDVDRLKKINALRKLDISTKDISTILDKPLEINKIMYKQLNLFKSRIQYINKSKEIIENLIEDYDKGNVDTTTDNLEKLIIYLDKDAKVCSGYMSKELERIFPGGFGRLMSIIYGAFLDEPIDNAEKEKAWIGLVNDLDSTVEVKFPEDIKNTLEEVFENINKEGISKFKTKNENLVNNVMAPINESTLEEKYAVDKRIEDTKKTKKYKDIEQKMKNFLEFLKENPQILPEDFGKNLKVLSSRFRMFGDNFGEVMKSKYKIAKAFDNIS